MAIFLHSAFRSGSTWFWHRFREAAGAHAYYEPFHEAMTAMTPDMIAEHRAEVWSSGHPPLSAPYFAEYAGLLRPRGGVALYQDRFAYESYYAAAEDDEQRRYIASLTDHARHLGKRPVFGFCRSLGRVPWMKRNCAGLHIVTWRDIWDQWASLAAQGAQRNAYFAFRLYLIACQGRHGSKHRAFFAGLPLPRPVGGSCGEREAYVRDFFFSTAAELRFRIFLRVNMLDMLLAMPQADLFVELDRMSDDADYRAATAHTLRHRTGLVALAFDDCALPHHPPTGEPFYRTALEEALDILAEQAPHHNPATSFLRDKLQEVLKRFAEAAPPPPPEEVRRFPRLSLHLVLFAMTLVQRDGGDTGQAMAFLRETFGEDFAAQRAGLGEIVHDILGRDLPSPPGQREAFTRLRGALLSDAPEAPPVVPPPWSIA